MSAIQLLQLAGGVAVLAGFAASRFARLRPYSRQIGLAVLIFYFGCGVALVIWRIVTGGAG